MPPPARALHPKVRTLWRLAALFPYLSLIAGLVAWSAEGLPPWAAAILAVAALPLVWVVPDARYRRWRYEIRKRDVYMARGVVFFEMAVVPFDRIQYVETRQGPLDRLLGLTQLVVHTAGGKEGIPGLEPEEAERLREELAKVAGTLSV